MPDLVITGIGLPPASIRGVTQTLAPIVGASQSARTVNGALVDLSATAFRKYESQITCRDQASPTPAVVVPEAERALVSLRAITGELRELARAHFVTGNRAMADRLDQIVRAIAADVETISGPPAPGPDRPRRRALTDHLDT